MSQRDDVATLAEPLRSAAVVLGNGEVMWPYDLACDAVIALARAGHVVLGVDARCRLGDAVPTEIPVSSFEPSRDSQDVERARREALAAIARAEHIDRWDRPDMLLTW